jgi:WD40 repeat protein
MSLYPANQQARAVCYGKRDGKYEHLVVCSNMGKVSVRDFNDLDRKIASLKDAQEWCEVARYSPCGNFLAFASHDNNLYVYSVSEDGEYTLYKSFAKHNSFVTAFDWSQDSSYIRTVCGAYEKLYFNITDKTHDAAGLTNTKDFAWATTSVKLGWDVQGVHPSGEDGTHVN